MKKTLLQKAKEDKKGRQVKKLFSQEEIELAVAWVNRHISHSQVGRAMEIKSTASAKIYRFLLGALSQYIRENKNLLNN